MSAFSRGLLKGFGGALGGVEGRYAEERKLDDQMTLESVRHQNNMTLEQLRKEYSTDIADQRTALEGYRIREQGRRTTEQEAGALERTKIMAEGNQQGKLTEAQKKGKWQSVELALEQVFPDIFTESFASFEEEGIPKTPREVIGRISRIANDPNDPNSAKATELLPGLMQWFNLQSTPGLTSGHFDQWEMGIRNLIERPAAPSMGGMAPQQAPQNNDPLGLLQ